jgi:hypothetical protein
MAMTIPSTQPATELLISALAAGDARILYSLRRTLVRASRSGCRARREELDALAGILDGLDRMGETGAGKMLEPTLRHLLARVL